MSESDTIEAVTRDWLERIIRHDGTTATEVARRASVPQSALTRFLKGESHKLQNKTVAKIARVSPIEPPTALTEVLAETEVEGQEHEVNFTTRIHDAIPVWGVIPVGRTGEFRLNPIPVASFPRPSHLAAGRRIAAFYAPDATMAPRWLEGEPVVVDLARPAAPNSPALIRLTSDGDPNDTETSVFRVYEGRRNGLVYVSRFDCEGSDGIPIDRVLEVRRVLDWKDILG